MHPQLVKSIDHVKECIGRFNQDLARPKDPASQRLAELLSYNRAWYLDPDTGLVGPSKFIGYAGMTAKNYVSAGALDGKQTEPILQRWFRTLDPNTPEERYVRTRVENLLTRHHKRLNRAVRFCAPIGWTLPDSTAEMMDQLRVQQLARVTKRPSSSVRRIVSGTLTRRDQGYVAECEHLNVVARGRSFDEAVANLDQLLAKIDAETLQSLGIAPSPVLQLTMESSPWPL